MNGNFLAEHQRAQVRRLQHLHERLGNFLDDAGEEPRAQSPADIESATFTDRDGVMVVLSQGRLLQEVTADNVLAVARTLTEPVQTIAPFSCARAAIEAGALCCWLLDDTIHAQARLSRSLTLRLDGIVEQEKLAREKPNRETMTILDGKRESLRRIAEAQTIAPCLNKRGRIIGFGKSMPKTTEVVRAVFGSAIEYRIYSAMVHGQLWAVTQLGFSSTSKPTPPRTVGLEKALQPAVAVHVVLIAAEALARTAWKWTLYCGFDHRKLSEILEASYDSFGADGVGRFWRTGTG